MGDEKKPYIFESPDGGVTVRVREMGDYENTITISSKEYFFEISTLNLPLSIASKTFFAENSNSSLFTV